MAEYLVNLNASQAAIRAAAVEELAEKLPLRQRMAHELRWD